MTRNLYYNIEDKANIICKHVGSDDMTTSCARKIAEATDGFTFHMLDDLVRAMKEIAEGND